MAFYGQSVHVGCAFSMVEIFSSLYGNLAKVFPENPRHPERDFIVLSKGHGVMAQYACFYELGWIGEQEVKNYFHDGSTLHGLSEAHIPGCEVTSGSLGHGLPIAVGMAKGLQLQGKNQKVFCIVGDGELNEGSMWEGFLFAAHHQLHQLVVIVDANEFQAMGKTCDVLNLEPLDAKFSSFGFEVAVVDGHDVEKITNTVKSLMHPQKPKAIIARTVKGKGISFMEGENKWHYTRIDQKTLDQCFQELDAGENKV